MNLKIENDRLVIYSEPDNKLYSIPYINLAELKTGSQKSYWIHQLSEKTWATNEILYGVAKIIQSEYPDNNIDWISTFKIVERGRYLDHATAVEIENNEATSNNTAVNNLMAAIRVGREENNDETNNTIALIVKSQLEKYGLAK